jgi:Fe2+ or Zn2+ uptake regulation protein
MKEKRNTIQKQIIIDAINTLCNHPTAEEVYCYVAEKCPTISKGTVYRNLKDMSDNGEILKVANPCGADRFDHNNTKHYHVECKICGRFADVEMCNMDYLYNKVVNANGFAINEYNIIFKGVCPKCGSKKSNK